MKHAFLPSKHTQKDDFCRITFVFKKKLPKLWVQKIFSNYGQFQTIRSWLYEPFIYIPLYSWIQYLKDSYPNGIAIANNVNGNQGL